MPLFYHKTVYNPLAHLYRIILHYTALDGPRGFYNFFGFDLNKSAHKKPPIKAAQSPADAAARELC